MPSSPRLLVTLVTLVVLVLAAGAVPLLGPAAPTPRADAASPAAAGVVPVRVLAYNIRHGSMGLDGVARTIRRTGAEVVLLNEVDTHRAGGVHQARYLARRLGMRWVYDANIRFPWGTRGNAVLTTYDVHEAERHDLHVPPGTRPRGLLRVRLATAGVRFDVWVTHLNPGHGKHRQARGVTRLVGRPTCATVVGGDMNAVPGSPVDRALRTHLRDVWRTDGRGRGHTNLRQDRRIDYLYAAHVRHRATWVTPLRSSDHRGVVGALGVDRRRSCR